MAELALWGQTLCRWDAPGQFPPSPTPPAPLHNYWIACAGLIALTLLITGLVLRSIRRIWRARHQWPHPLPRVQAIVFALALAAIPAYLCIPRFQWILVLLLLAILEIVTTRFFALASPNDATSEPRSEGLPARS